MSAPQLFTDGVKMIGSMPTRSISRFQDALPAALVDAWRAWGEIATTDGFVRAIDPDSLRGVPMPPALAAGIPAFTTAWGDVLTLDDGRWHLISYRTGVHAPVFDDDETIFARLEDRSFQREVLLRDGYESAVEVVGEPDARSCIGFVRLLARGGATDPSNLALRRIDAHLVFLARVCGLPRPESEAPRFTGAADAASFARERLRSVTGASASGAGADESVGADAAAAPPLRGDGVAGVMAWLAAREGSDAFPPEGDALGSFGDMETELLVAQAGEEFELRERQRGTTRILARASQLDDLLRYLVVQVVLEPVRQVGSGGSGVAIGAAVEARDVEVLDVGDGVEARWQDGGGAHAITGFGDRNSVDLFLPLRRSSPEEIVAAKPDA